MKIATALRLGRVSNLPTVASNVLTGAFLSGSNPSPERLLGWMLAMASFYVGGMYLNDAFDRRWDAEHRPERPIPAGEVTAKLVFALGFALLGAGGCASFLLAGGLAAPAQALPALASALALLVTIVTYDAYHKGNPFGPLLMGVCRVLIYLTVALGLGGRWGLSGNLAAAGLLGYLIGLTYLARQENLREVTQLWPLLLLSAPLFMVLPLNLDLRALCCALLLAWVVHSLRFLFDPTRRDIPGAVSRLIAGVALVDAVVVAADAPIYALCCVAALVLTRLLHAHVAGT